MTTRRNILSPLAKSHPPPPPPPPLTPLSVQAVSAARVADMEEAMAVMAAEINVRCPAAVFPTVLIHVDDF